MFIRIIFTESPYIICFFFFAFSAIILFIVENRTMNISDQRLHEFEIRRLNQRAKVVRRTLTEIADGGKLTPDRELLV